MGVVLGFFTIHQEGFLVTVERDDLAAAITTQQYRDVARQPTVRMIARQLMRDVFVPKLAENAARIIFTVTILSDEDDLIVRKIPLLSTIQGVMAQEDLQVSASPLLIVHPAYSVVKLPLTVLYA
ncbi:MAG: hypothetical protein K8L97_23235 [Anaerolineae bacterium]|nr:hypothetical protein [Anaerolineae bacterium]